ncbi:hypothetical protein MRX96_019077 [Rhipicephalus microplus]
MSSARRAEHLEALALPTPPGVIAYREVNIWPHRQSRRCGAATAALPAQAAIAPVWEPGAQSQHEVLAAAWGGSQKTLGRVPLPPARPEIPETSGGG